MSGSILLVLGGVGALFFGAEWLVRGAAQLARKYGVSPIVVGLTVVSLGTSAPELVVAVTATLRDSGNLVIGNVLGSNLANTGLILGITALVMPLQVSSRVVSREVPIMLLITLLLYPVIMDLHISRVEGVMLVGLLTAYLAVLFLTAKNETPEVRVEYEQFGEAAAFLGKDSPFRAMGLVIAGSLGLVVGGQAIVDGATALARIMGVTELVIGVSVVAIGTSLPELATTLVAALRKEADIAVGNIVGSNIFNLTAILGAAALMRPVDISAEAVRVEYPAVLAITLLVIPAVAVRYKIRRWEGGLLLFAYLGLGTWILLV